ncbi:MAG: phosphoglycolate phosphatase [Solirubrobacteraceae bacterium]|nr:phosphoglycolate phosphatase [Solirubrobacteraceae bacterium]
MTRPSLLLLWDIDGTLMQRASEAHALSLLGALREVHGDGLALEDVRVEAAGRTDGAIARDLLRACGVAEADIDRSVEEVARRCASQYAQLCPADLSGFVAPGIGDLLATLAGDARFRLSLVTGNFEPVARMKLERAGIGRHFPPGQGGFGTDAEEREALPPIARGRAGGWPRERTLVIGDTPRDIACARADGLRVVAVTTGPFDAAALIEADHVASGAEDLAPLLESLAA